MRIAPVKIDQQARRRYRAQKLLTADEFVTKLAQTPLEKLTGRDRLLAALYRQSELFPEELKNSEKPGQ